MKPTQQEIIELAREAGAYELMRINGVQDSVLGMSGNDSILRFATLLLERFSAGGGEPVGIFREDDDIGHVDLIPHQQLLLKEGDKLYTHHSPTDLHAEYLRGLEDAKKACESWANQHSSASGGCTHVDCDFMAAALDCAEAIEALKGKQ